VAAEAQIKRQQLQERLRAQKQSRRFLIATDDIAERQVQLEIEVTTEAVALAELMDKAKLQLLAHTDEATIAQVRWDYNITFHCDTVTIHRI
jgi:hypothetical protein